MLFMKMGTDLTSGGVPVHGVLTLSNPFFQDNILVLLMYSYLSNFSVK